MSRCFLQLLALAVVLMAVPATASAAVSNADAIEIKPRMNRKRDDPLNGRPITAAAGRRHFVIRSQLSGVVGRGKRRAGWNGKYAHSSEERYDRRGRQFWLPVRYPVDYNAQYYAKVMADRAVLRGMAMFLLFSSLTGTSGGGASGGLGGGGGGGGGIGALEPDPFGAGLAPPPPAIFPPDDIEWLFF
ncbi:uncharacterized protein LOC129587373 isoform X2 [Paramacrobiotus metropolitanus]|uniref:uncharacterized protein LOC129587373 isoform X2 n=1 Tax=Paramacrobiotus metropolitanus TaxID=2943436 RepID=UPI0024457B00|nr:uncharacterized protein LOC129587373 isoform X2 [Paramacrobiotus metropolitanus]